MEFFGSFDEFLRIGNFTITMYALCILIGAAIAAFISTKEGKLLGLKTEDLLDGILFGLPIGIAGARIYYVMFEWGQFYDKGDIIGTIINVVDIRSGGLGITGGIIAAVIWAYFWCKRKNLHFLKVFDLLAPGMLIAQACGRWGNFFNKEAHGGVMSDFAYNLLDKLLPDFILQNMKIGSYYRHPTFLYESLWNIVGLIIILIVRKKWKKVQLGDFIGFYLIWYGIGRATLIEPFRTDALMLGSLRINVVIPALFAVGGVIYIIVKHKMFPQESYVLEKERIALEGPQEVVVTEKKPFFKTIVTKFKVMLELDEESIEKSKKNDEIAQKQIENNTENTNDAENKGLDEESNEN